MRVVEALWDAAEVVVGLGWAMAPMQAATVAVSAPMEEQEEKGLRILFLEPTPSEEAMGLQHRVMLEDLGPARDTTPTAGLLQTMRWASMLEGRLQARL